jgi:dsDNA-binding SOS-regulon protein
MWTTEAQEALDKVKELLMKAPILVLLAKKEPLLLYIAATTHVVSATLVVEREEAGHILKVQRPVYFISKVLADSKTRYP